MNITLMYTVYPLYMIYRLLINIILMLFLLFLVVSASIRTTWRLRLIIFDYRGQFAA